MKYQSYVDIDRLTFNIGYNCPIKPCINILNNNNKTL